jgi:hypothetical protein
MPVLLFTVSWKVMLITLISGCLLDRLRRIRRRYDDTDDR